MSPNGVPPAGSRTPLAAAVASIPVAIGLLTGALSDGGPAPNAPVARVARADGVTPFSVTIDGQAVHVYFGNLHSHTGLSDGSSDPKHAFAYARDVAGLDFLAVTEHNHAQAGRLQSNPELYTDSLVAVAGSFTDPGRFVALYGQEFSSISSGNHANVLDVADVIRSSEVRNGDWRSLLVNWMPGHLDSSGQQAVTLLNHPATAGSPNTLEYGVDDFPAAEWRATLDARAELINVENGPSHQENQPPGRPSEHEFLRYLNLGFHLAPTADQDNHLENWGTAADTRTGVVAAELTKPAIMAALRARHVYATEDRDLRLVATVNGHLMGSQVTPGNLTPGDPLDLRLVIQDDDEPFALYDVDVYSDVPGGSPAEVAASVAATGNGTVAIPGVSFEGDGQYVFFRITQHPDEDQPDDHAWTAPVWFEQNAPPPPGGESAVSLAVNVVTEEARITNMGVDTVDLAGWRLLSVKGNQEFLFPAARLAPQASVTVVSGPGRTANPPAVLLWGLQRIWNNDGDPGELYDRSGHLVAQTGS